eukprot:TRINITY_DN375_c0_g1_i1.p1 TRINITY_DN375_c0_g1~~TRINITY_DN375_c0_g1_i1.p1  ORF type:complete len:395 (+),score=18.45 TRINITY_DN375_c0_g1_i1:51-1235(+)
MHQSGHWLISCVVLLFISCSYSSEEVETSSRDEKILNVFSVVRFRNDPCTTGDNRNGTCYTADECTSRGGSNSGNCASGYGVCCVFSLGCGGRSAENCTYFTGMGTENGQCRLTICPCSDNICQLRLDFNTFTIAGPATATTSVAKTPAGKELTDEQRCLTDTFSVTNPGGSTPPTICGVNNGEHMFLDSSEQCNDLVFNLASENVRQTWNIKVTQYSCDFDNLAPSGCTQYFFGSKSGTLKTYNFDGGQHLDSQDQRICIRRERGNCQVCYSATADGDFEVSGEKAGATGVAIVKTFCCGYGPMGAMESGFDCVMIPGATKKTDATDLALVAARGLCGTKFAGTHDGAAAKTICSKQIPFNIRFLSDLREQATKEKGQNPNGFKIFYEMFACT